jgi:hypothetical protein
MTSPDAGHLVVDLPISFTPARPEWELYGLLCVPRLRQCAA